MSKKYILNEAQADLKIQRMALQILEDLPEDKSLILAGVAPNGIIIARRLQQLLQAQAGLQVWVQQIDLDKKHPTHIAVSPGLPLDDKVVILVDDVANSGRTLTYAIKPYLDAHPHSIHTLVLVDRTHKKFPIQPDYVGFSLASTLEEYIDLDVEHGAIKGAWMQ